MYLFFPVLSEFKNNLSVFNMTVRINHFCSALRNTHSKIFLKINIKELSSNTLCFIVKMYMFLWSLIDEYLWRSKLTKLSVFGGIHIWKQSGCWDWFINVATYTTGTRIMSPWRHEVVALRRFLVKNKRAMMALRSLTCI
jgi:hypothetical protein